MQLLADNGVNYLDAVPLAHEARHNSCSACLLAEHALAHESLVFNHASYAVQESLLQYVTVG